MTKNNGNIYIKEISAKKIWIFIFDALFIIVLLVKKYRIVNSNNIFIHLSLSICVLVIKVVK